MSNIEIVIRERSRLFRDFHIGLRGQMALLGTCGIIVTGAICLAALHYTSVVENEWIDSNKFKFRVALLSQGFLESRQIAGDFLRKPGEMWIKRYAEGYERQLTELSRIEEVVSALPHDDPLKQATSLRSVLDLYATRFHNVVAAQRNATSASTKMMAFRVSCARQCMSLNSVSQS